MISEPAQKIDQLLAYLLVADYSQSYVYRNKVLTLAQLREVHGNNPDAFASALQNAVNDYMRPHFEKISVSAVATDVVGNGQYNVALVVRVTDTSQEYSSTWQYSATDSKFVKAATIANTGTY